ncbi:DUF2029 domain-containing protein [bacterium]|nr:DUF2029 domain-containing protein [bacterium]
MKKINHFFLLLACSIHLLFWVSLGIGFLDGLFNDSSHRIGKGGDFFQFYQAGHNLLKGKSIYTAQGELVIPYGALNKYPPLLSYTVGLSAQVVSPFTAYKVWVIAIGIFFMCFVLVIRALVPNRQIFLQVVSMSLVFTPYYLDMYMGQTNTLMAFLISLLMLCSVRGNKKPVTALALSLNIKMNTFLCIPVYIANRWWKALFMTAALSAVVFFPYFLIHPKDLSYFLKYVCGAPLDYFYQAGNIGIYPLLADIVSMVSDNKRIIPVAHTLWVVSVLCIAGYVHVRTRTTDPIDCIVLWMSTFFISFKFVWEHHLVMFLPLLAMEFSRNDRRSIGIIWILLALPTPFCLLNMDLGSGYTEVQEYWTHAESMVYHAGKILPMGAFFILVLMRLMSKKVVFKKVLTGIVVAWSAVCLLAFATPSLAGDYIAKARVALYEKNLLKAEQMFQKAIRINPSSCDAWVEYGRFLYNTGLPEKANEALLKARVLNPNHPIFQDKQTK